MVKALPLLLLAYLAVPAFVSAQSLEWLAEHPGSTTPAMYQVASSAPVVVTNTNDGVEAKVRAFFSDTPVMIAIAECESRFREFDNDGKPLSGGSGGMIGIYQINESVHTANAKSLGMDIYTTDGNLAYAKKLYAEEGTDPWLDSFSCWNQQQLNQVAAGGKNTLTQNLVLGIISPEVKALQVLLNKSGYTVATEGPGSPGEETTKFGAFTRIAVRKFQCDKMKLCGGDEGSTGYGVVGAQTRNALLALSETSFTAEASTASAANADEGAQIDQLRKQIAELTAQLLALKQKQS